MNKCKWAGDASDEYCKDCNGCELMFEGQKKIATDCMGYEPSEEEVATTESSEVTKETEKIMNKPIKEVKKESKPKNEKTKEKTKKDDTVVEHGSDSSNAIPCSAIIINDFKHSVVKSIKIMSGVTKEVNGVYYKFTYEQENILDDNLTPEQIDEEKEKLWTVANSEVDRQLMDVCTNE